MMLPVNIFQPVKSNMRINLGRADVGVSKNRLHRPQVCAVLHHMGSTTMTQHMWAGMPANRQGGRLYQLPDSLPCQPPSTRRGKKQRRISAGKQRTSRACKIGGQCVLCGAAKRYD